MNRVAVRAVLLLVVLGLCAWLAFETWWRPARQQDEVASLLPGEGGPTLASTAKKPVATDESAREREAARHLMNELRDMDEEAQTAFLWNRVRSLPADAMPFSEELVRHLVGLLTSESRSLAETARTFLSRLGPRVAPFLHPLLASDATELQKARALALIQRWHREGRDVALPPFIPLLDDEHGFLQKMTLSILARGVPYETDLALRLVELLKERPTGDLMGPGTALARMGAQGVAHLVALDGSEEVKDRIAAFHGLGRAAAADLKPHLSLLATRIGDVEEDMRVRIAAILALRTMHGDCLSCLDALRRTLMEDSYDLVNPTLGVLKQMGQRAAPAVPDILRWLDETDPRLVDRTAQTLGAIRARPDLVLPALEAVILRQGSDDAARAMAAYGSPAFEYAARILSEGDEYARYSILWTFANLGEKAAPIVPELIVLIDGEDPDISSRAIGTLGFIGPKAAAAVPTLMKRLSYGETVLRAKDAARTLMRLGPRAEEALLSGLQSSHETTRRQSLRVLTHFHVRTAFALDALGPLTRSKDARIRADAMDAVGAALFDPREPQKVYPAAEDPATIAKVRALLEAAVEDPEEPVRDRATRYLDWLNARP